jgi:hypothetical protein
MKHADGHTHLFYVLYAKNGMKTFHFLVVVSVAVVCRCRVNTERLLWPVAVCPGDNTHTRVWMYVCMCL